MLSAIDPHDDTPGDLVWDLPCVQQASYLEGGPLMWMLPLCLHVNQKSDEDDDNDGSSRLYQPSWQTYLEIWCEICHACSKPATWKGANWCGCRTCTCMLIKNLMMMLLLMMMMMDLTDVNSKFWICHILCHNILVDPRLCLLCHNTPCIQSMLWGYIIIVIPSVHLSICPSFQPWYFAKKKNGFLIIL